MVVYQICNVTVMYLSRSMWSLYLEVFVRHCRDMTLRYFDTAICAVKHLVDGVVTKKSISAGSEITPSLHMKSRPSVAMQCDEIL